MPATHLGEHAGTARYPGGFVWYTVDAHGLAVAGELQGELLAPHFLDDVVADGAELTLVQPSFVCVVEVELLYQYGEGCFCCFTNLLVDVLGLGTRIQK